jgi:putative phosphoribosyl transferase
MKPLVQQDVQIPSGSATLQGSLCLPAGATGVVLFAHGSGSSRSSPRNVFVAQVLQQAGLGTLLFDLLTPQEERVDIHTREYRFDIGLLTRRLYDATLWLDSQAALRSLAIGYFGASTGSAAALAAAAQLGYQIAAVVSRGGRPDLVPAAQLARVSAAALLIVGGEDEDVLELNRQAFQDLTGDKQLAVVAGASHLFEEAGALEEVARLAAAWFSEHLQGQTAVDASSRQP